MQQQPLRRVLAAIALVGPLALSAAACSSGSDGETAGDETTTSSTTSTSSAADDGVVVTESGPITLAVGETATIRLDANPTTGYQWEPSAEPDESVIRVVSDTYEGADSNVVGSGGTQEVVVEGTGAGTTTFELRYVRPWEDGVAPAETATFDITVS